MDDMDVCPGCGKKSAEGSAGRQQAVATLEADPNVVVCPRCGVDVPRGVLRCRDCGSYVSEELAEAARARGLIKDHQLTDDVGYAQNEEAPTAASDDDDFVTETPMTASEDDFEYTDYTAGGHDEYQLSEGGAPPAIEESTQPVEQYQEQPEYAEQPAEGYDDASGVPSFEAPAEEATAEQPAEVEDTSVPHSVATAGDALLSAALQEETEAQKRRARGGRKSHKGKALPPGSFVVYCPQGCRIVVQEKHRGRTGRCPQCKSLFFVPPAPVAQAAGEATAEAAAPATSKYTAWIQDVRLHKVNPLKLKLKPDSLLNDFEAHDIGIQPEHLLLVSVHVAGGMFGGGGDAKKKALREQINEHLSMKGSPEGLPPKHTVLTAEALAGIKVVQPSIPGEESVFADIPVFGSGRIAVRLPAADTASERAYVSFGLSQFRALCEALEPFGVTHVRESAVKAGVPMTDETTEYACHYTETRMQALNEIKYQQADPAMPLVLLGWKCGGCGLIVSEDARKKEKIGGKSESSVPKAKCPKCKKPMGNNRLMGLKG